MQSFFIRLPSAISRATPEQLALRGELSRLQAERYANISAWRAKHQRKALPASLQQSDREMELHKAMENAGGLESWYDPDAVLAAVVELLSLSAAISDNAARLASRHEHDFEEKIDLLADQSALLSLKRLLDGCVREWSSHGPVALLRNAIQTVQNDLYHASRSVGVAHGAHLFIAQRNVEAMVQILTDMLAALPGVENSTLRFPTEEELPAFEEARARLRRG